MARFDIRRQIKESDTTIGGVTTTSTAIETRFMDLQHLGGKDLVELEGLRIEANYKGYCHEETSLREQDTITDDSGTTQYQVMFVENLWREHVKFFAKKVI